MSSQDIMRNLQSKRLDSSILNVRVLQALSEGFNYLNILVLVVLVVLKRLFFTENGLEIIRSYVCYNGRF